MINIGGRKRAWDYIIMKIYIYFYLMPGHAFFTCWYCRARWEGQGHWSRAHLPTDWLSPHPHSTRPRRTDDDDHHQVLAGASSGFQFQSRSIYILSCKRHSIQGIHTWYGLQRPKCPMPCMYMSSFRWVKVVVVVQKKKAKCGVGEGVRECSKVEKFI